MLDKTKTAMGARLLRNYIEQPLIEKDEMEKRLGLPMPDIEIGYLAMHLERMLDSETE